jgi:hypothetical protein
MARLARLDPQPQPSLALVQQRGDHSELARHQVLVHGHTRQRASQTVLTTLFNAKP